MKRLIVTALALVALRGWAAPETALNAKTSPELRNQAALKRTGGSVVYPDSGKGFVAIVNAQRRVAREDIDRAIAALRKEASYVFRVVAAETEDKDASMTIRLVDVEGKPPMTVMPERFFAEVNVAALAEGLTTESSLKKFVPVRTRIAIMRAFAFAAGAGGSAFPGNLLDATSVRDFDYYKEFLPADSVEALNRHLKKRGMKPERITSYRFACEEGWAPAPTNDIQKAIWDEVHAIPEKPMKITYDKDRQKPVVK